MVRAAARLADLVLGTQARVRMRTPMFLVSVMVYAASCAMALYAERLGIVRAGFALPVTVLCAAQAVVFYGLLRSGRSLRFRDPDMMLAQNVFALCAITCGYAMVDPVDRGIVQILVCVVVVFSMYTLSPRQSLALGLLSALLFAVPMLVMPLYDPAWFPPQLELHRFELMAGTLPALTGSARYIAHWRDKVVWQKRELRLALARVQELATRDPLTGLCNRGHMQTLLEEAAARSAEGGADFCLALVDLDHFKQINDRHGHRTGDLALQAFARACVQVLRTGELAARWGGEEFLILFPGAGTDAAGQALERLRLHLAAQPVCEELPNLRVTFSAGVARHRRGDAVDHSVERADRTLYLAKDEGRDRSLLARDTTIPAALDALE